MRSCEKLDKRNMDALDETRGQLVTLNDGTQLQLTAADTYATSAGHEAEAVPDEAVVLSEVRSAPQMLREWQR